MYINDDFSLINEYIDIFIFINIKNDSLKTINEFRNQQSTYIAVNKLKEDIIKISPNSKIVSQDKEYCLLRVSDIKSNYIKKKIDKYIENKKNLVVLDSDSRSFLFNCSISIIKFKQKYDCDKKDFLNFMCAMHSAGQINSIEEFKKNAKILTDCSSLLTFENCFNLKFMPIIGHSKQGVFGTVIFYEALLDNRTDTNTGDLIKILEQYGYSQFLDFSNFCNIIDLLKNNSGFSISMNVCKDLIENEEFAKFMEKIYKNSNIEKRRIVLEILEYQAIDREKLESFTERFRKLGCLIAIDDFGVGYHSLELICSLEFDFLKIRGELFEKSVRNEMLGKILSSIVVECKKKKITFIVEQVSNQKYLDFALNNIKADGVQGFLYPAITLEQLIEDKK